MELNVINVNTKNKVVTDYGVEVEGLLLPVQRKNKTIWILGWFTSRNYMIYELFINNLTVY